MAAEQAVALPIGSTSKGLSRCQRESPKIAIAYVNEDTA
jgi:hypothetical protein